MSFNYDVIADEQEALKAREFPTLPNGIYDFEIIEAKFKYSSACNAMIELKLRIIHEGVTFNVFDNLIATRNMTWKTKHFCETVGLEQEYLAGKFNEHLALKKRGTCAINYVEARPKNDGTLAPDGSPAMWKAKNEVTDYLSPDKISGSKSQANENPFAPPADKLPPAPAGSEPFLNDDIPF